MTNHRTLENWTSFLLRKKLIYADAFIRVHRRFFVQFDDLLEVIKLYVSYYAINII